MSSKITIRKATWSDLQAITNIAIAVYPQIPADRYEFPYADKYPRDFEKFKFEETKTFLNNDLYPRKDLHSMVAEIEDDAGEKIIIAHAMWDLLALKDKSKVPAMNKLTITTTQEKPCATRRDANWKRIEYYTSVILPAMWEYLEPSDRTSWPRSYIHLERIATAPEWQRHGAGTVLCNWGLSVAQEHNLPIGLFATPSGQGLYTKLGFKEMNLVFVQVPGEEESVTVTAMKWCPKSISQGWGIWSLGRFCRWAICNNKCN